MGDEIDNGRDGSASLEQAAGASTTPTHNIALVGMPSEEFAREVGQTIGAYAREIGRYLPLQGLDGITVASDYRSALEQLDRGFEASAPLTPTEDLAVGVAMAPLVKRDGELKTHIVIDANVAAAIVNNNEQERRLGLYTLAHELAHCACHTELSAAFPQYLLIPITEITADPIQIELFAMTDGCFGEYYACRASATFNPEGLDAMDEIFGKALTELPADIENRKAAYRFSGDIDQFFQQAKAEYGRVMIFAAYVMGHIDGLPKASVEDAPSLKRALEGKFGSALTAEWEALRGIWERLGESSDPVAEFLPLRKAGSELLHAAGVEISSIDGGGFYVNVPFNCELAAD